jgi:hypothetical protein
MRSLPVIFFIHSVLACIPDTELRDQTNPGTSTPTRDSLASPDAGPPIANLFNPLTTAVNVPTNLQAVLLGFPEEVIAGAGAGLPSLIAADGVAFPLTLGERLACGGFCYLAKVGGLLAPHTEYRVDLSTGSLVFLDGKPLAAGVLGRFTTGLLSDEFAPRIQSFAFETREGCMVVHLTADESVRVRVELGGVDVPLLIDSAGFSPSHDFSRLDHRLPMGTRVVARAKAIDQAGNEALSPDQTLLLPDPLPSVALVELLPNPAGSETTQEWVEIVNHGQSPIEVGGLILADKAGSDVLPAQVLAPGERALIVGEAYLPTDPKDIPPREGAPLIRVSGKLGGDGLSNAGEVVRLLSSKGEVVSQFGGQVNTSATAWSGKSVARVSPRACDGIAAWSATPQTPTPGW